MNLLFVYNAHSNVVNTALDIAHKIFSPNTYSCNLCNITHGIFQEKRIWTQFLDTLQSQGITCLFYHKDEFFKEYPRRKDQLPALFIRNTTSPYELSVLVSSVKMNQIKSVEEMITLLKAILP